MEAMAAHRDILDERESYRRPLASSVILHASVLVVALAHTWLGGATRERWGDPTSLGGGAVAITPVGKIPLPPRGGLQNPVANDTESRVPQPPTPQAARAGREDPEAIAIRSRSRTTPKTRTMASRQRYRPEGADRPNQLYSPAGAAASSPIYGTTSGAGTVGLGAGSPFGARFGYYEQILRQRVARAWRTNEVDPRLQSAPPIIVTFEIRRDGSVRNLRVLQPSGNATLDYSAQRAILEAGPFPRLPDAYERDSALIEFWFQWKR